MKGMKHPFSRAQYEQDGEGGVRVTRGDGTWGRFRRDGRWVEGELRECDPHFANWVGGPKVVHHRVKTD